MGSKNKTKVSTSNNAVIAHRKRTLSDGTEFEIAVYTPVFRSGEYISKLRMVINGEAEEFCLDESSSVDALKYAVFILRYEMNDKGIVGDREHPTGLEVWHSDPDMNSLFQHIVLRELSLILLYRDTISRGRFHGTQSSCKQVGGETIIGMEHLDALVERSTTVNKLHHIIRIRIVELAIQRRFEGPLFEFGRVPKVRRLSKAKNTCPPIATTTRLVKETKKNAHISVWAPIQDSGNMLWRCQYQIDGLGHRIVAETEGIDSMEALTSVFDAIADDLDSSPYTVAYAAENGELDSRFNNYGNHGFERHGEPEMNRLLTHMFTAEVLRNNILYWSIANASKVAELEAKMLHHVAEAHRVGLQIDRRLCRGEPILQE